MSFRQWKVSKLFKIPLCISEFVFLALICPRSFFGLMKSFVLIKFFNLCKSRLLFQLEFLKNSEVICYCWQVSSEFFKISYRETHCRWFRSEKHPTKAHSLSKKFCTIIPFSKNDSWCQLWLGWKDLVEWSLFQKMKIVQNCSLNEWILSNYLSCLIWYWSSHGFDSDSSRKQLTT